jgi:hypothetical protein
MAKAKYNPEAEPLRNKHYGYTFQSNNYGHSFFPASKSGRKRYPHQWAAMHFNQKAVTRWREMSTETKAAWASFAATYPQPSKKDPEVFLTGYQLFIKRNFYIFQHEGLEMAFMTEPALDELPLPEFTITIEESGQCVDVTEQYIRYFGLLPEPGQFVICRIIPISANSAQFFAPFFTTAEVIAVYMDALIVSFNFSANFEDVVFSLYLSKPVWESVRYPGTKFRYMGCFKPNKFIQLSDTPETYDGQAGKIVSVKDDESGVEFIPPSGCDYCLPTPTEADAGKVVTVNPAGDGYTNEEAGGGSFDCDDLLNCDIFTQLQEQIEAIGKVVSNEHSTSIPPVKFGLLYNGFAAVAATTFLKDGWFVATEYDLLDLDSYLGGISVAGGKLKSLSSQYWSSPNTAATNEYFMNWKGSGQREYLTGLFTQFLERNFIWSSSDFGSSSVYFRQARYNNAGLLRGTSPKNQGGSIIPCRAADGIADGVKNTYIGNNGRIYRTVTLMQLEWLADPLAETKFNDGTEIPEITDDSAWLNSTSPALCAFNNDWSNV